MKTRRRGDGKKTKKRPLRPFGRVVHVNGKAWSYRVTGSTVAIRDPDASMTVYVPHTKFTGMNWQELEDTSRKGNPGYSIAPQDVKDFIENGLEPVCYKDQHYRFTSRNRGYERPGKA